MEFIHAVEDSIKNITYLNYKDDRWRGGKNTFYLKGRELKHNEMAYKIEKKFPETQTVSPVNSGEMFVYKNGKIK